MPELPEVQTVVDTLTPLQGGRIAAVRLLRPDIVTPPQVHLPPLLTGRVIRQISRRGKRIVLTLDDGNRFYIHLGMSGQLTVDPPEAPLRKHTHLVIGVEAPPGGRAGPHRGPGRARGPAPTQVRFCDPRRFGGIWWLGRNLSPDERMGPEPLELRVGQLTRLLARTRRPIKAALLDQRLIAGLGNIYADEALFEAGIHPLLQANRLSAEQTRRLGSAIKRVLRKAIRHRGSTLRDYRDANGQPGAFQDLHQVYAREDKPCRRCRSPIHRIVLGGRSTHFCPTCQKGLPSA